MGPKCQYLYVWLYGKGGTVLSFCQVRFPAEVRNWGLPNKESESWPLGANLFIIFDLYHRLTVISKQLIIAQLIKKFPCVLMV
jgi:hypothetical protein